MTLLTAQQITRFYDLYNAIDVPFTKEVIQAIGLVPKQIFLKYLGFQLPCLVYSSSMIGAKIIVNVKNEPFMQMRNGGGIVSLRFCITPPDKTEPLSFFVNSKIAGYSPYGDNDELNFVTLSFTQKPPDDLISTLGQLLDVDSNAKRRREDRIVMNPDSLRRLEISEKDAIVNIQGIPRKCIVRDLSFSGARLIVTGIGKFLLDKEAVLLLEFEESRRRVEIKGKIVRCDLVEGHKDLAALAVQFDEASIPLDYKIHINDALTSGRPLHGETPVGGEI